MVDEVDIHIGDIVFVGGFPIREGVGKYPDFGAWEVTSLPYRDPRIIDPVINVKRRDNEQQTFPITACRKERP